MKKTFQFIFILMLLTDTHICIAQDQSINTDRPDQTDGVYTVPANSFQIENGVMVAKNTFINNFMLRFGLTKATELRLLIDAGKEDRLQGLKPVTLSLKQRLFKQKGILPAIAFIGDISYGKIAGKSFKSPDVPFELKLSFENDLSEKFSLGYNVGTSNQFRDLNITFEGSYSISNAASVFLEYFSSFYKTASDHNFDAGILFIVKPRLQLDIAGGISLSERRMPAFATFGVSYLFNR